MKYRGDIITEAVLDAVSKDSKLTPMDFKIFWCWYRDSLEFNLSTSALAARAGTSIDNIHRNLERLNAQQWINVKSKKQTRLSGGKWSPKNTITPGESLTLLVQSLTAGQNEGFTAGQTVGQNDGPTILITERKNTTAGQNDGRNVVPDASAGTPPSSKSEKNLPLNSDASRTRAKGLDAKQHKETDEEYKKRRRRELDDQNNLETMIRAHDDLFKRQP